MGKLQTILLVIWSFLTSPKMKTFYWQTGGNFVAVLAGTLALIKPDEVGATTFLFISMAGSGLIMLTKEINKHISK